MPPLIEWLTLKGGAIVRLWRYQRPRNGYRDPGGLWCSRFIIHRPLAGQFFLTCWRPRSDKEAGMRLMPAAAASNVRRPCQPYRLSPSLLWHRQPNSPPLRARGRVGVALLMMSRLRSNCFRLRRRGAPASRDLARAWAPVRGRWPACCTAMLPRRQRKRRGRGGRAAPGPVAPGVHVEERAAALKEERLAAVLTMATERTLTSPESRMGGKLAKGVAMVAAAKALRFPPPPPPPRPQSRSCTTFWACPPKRQLRRASRRPTTPAPGRCTRTAIQTTSMLHRTSSS